MNMCSFEYLLAGSESTLGVVLMDEVVLWVRDYEVERARGLGGGFSLVFGKSRVDFGEVKNVGPKSGSAVWLGRKTGKAEESGWGGILCEGGAEYTTESGSSLSDSSDLSEQSDTPSLSESLRGSQFWEDYLVLLAKRKIRQSVYVYYGRHLERWAEFFRNGAMVPSPAPPDLSDTPPHISYTDPHTSSYASLRVFLHVAPVSTDQHCWADLPGDQKLMLWVDSIGQALEPWQIKQAVQAVC